MIQSRIVKRMGDLDYVVRIKTSYPDPNALLRAYGRTVAHGCFRVPAKLTPGRPFILTFLTKSNVAAIKGTAEVVSQENGTTWVRFLSAADPRSDADIVLTDVRVAILPSTVVTTPMRGAAVGLAFEEEREAVPTAMDEARPADPGPPGQPGSRIESAIAGIPQPTATGTGRGAALGNGLPEELASPSQGEATAPVRRPADRPSERIISAKRSAERPADRPTERPSEPHLTEPAAARRSAERPGSERPPAGAPATAVSRVRTGRRSAQHPAVRLVTQPEPGGIPAREAELSASRTQPAGHEDGRGDGADRPAPSAARARRLSDYPQSARPRAPARVTSKPHHGLPEMPAIAGPEELRRGPSYPMHHEPQQQPQPLDAAAMASSSGPLPEGTGAEQAQPDRGALDDLTPPPRKEDSGAMALVTVVPWWTQPPERASSRATALAPSTSSPQLPTSEAAVDFAEATRPELAHSSSEALQVRPPAPRAASAERPSSSGVFGMTSAAASAAASAMSAEARLIEAARRSVELPPVEEPVSRRVMWGSIAIAVTCAVVALGAVWWALDLRASVKARGSAVEERRRAPPSSAAPPPGPASPPPGPGAPATSAPPHAAAGAPPPCRLRVSASANPADLVVDGVARGVTPATVDVPCGEVTVELRRARYAPATRAVRAAPGVTDVDVRLARPVVSVRVLSRPPGLTVRLNGQDLGKTPLSAEVPAFEHGTLLWLAANGATRTQQIYPQENGATYTTNLER